ncbi:MAG: hypothetical protein J1F18_09025 [Lachnospiraceae bacterium]|nr:hypothetical protein [Lachnospiraceae bacterium]
MIRNIEDEKKRITRRHDSDFSGYLSDEALNELIGHVETHEMLHAPAHLKDNVIAQIRREKKNAGRRQIFSYRAKVLVAMAAALTILILMPDDGTQNVVNTVMQQRADESLEQMAMRRQEDMNAEWEKYLKERESGGMRGFFRNINEKVTEFGTSLYNSIGGE